MTTQMMWTLIGGVLILLIVVAALRKMWNKTLCTLAVVAICLILLDTARGHEKAIEPTQRVEVGIDDFSTTTKIYEEESGTSMGETTDYKADIVKDLSLSTAKTFSEGEAFIQSAYKSNDVDFMKNLKEYHKLLMIWIYSLREANVITDFLTMLLNTRTPAETDEEFLKDYSFQISDINNILAYLDSERNHIEPSDNVLNSLIGIVETTIAAFNQTSVEYCLEKGYMNVVRLIVKRGSELNKVDKNGDTLAHIFALAGNVEALRVLKEQGLDLDKRNNEGLTPMYYAAKRGQDNVIEYLKTQGIKVCYADKNGDTLLHIAAMNGDLTAAESLIKAGAPLDANNEAITPFYRAAQYGNFDMMKYLTEKGADTLWVWKGNQLIHWAARYNHTTAIEKFIEFGIEVNSRTDHSYTPLHWAARGGLTGMAQYLIEHGADINAKTDVGRTPMHEAAYWCQYSMVELLFKNGGSPGESDHRGNKPISLANWNDHFAMVDLLNDLEAKSKPIEVPTESQ